MLIFEKLLGLTSQFFYQEKRTTSDLNSYSFVTTKAIIMKMHDRRMRIVIKTHMKFR